MKIVFTADLHLDSAFGAEDRAARNRDLVSVFRGIVQYAVNIGAGAVVIGGDLFDTPYPTDLTVGTVKRIIKDSGIPFYAVAGNHDPLYSTSFYSDTPDNMFVFGAEVESVDIGGIRLYGASVTQYTDCRDIWRGVTAERGSLLVCHGTVGGEGAHLISRDSVEATGAELVLMGHIHKTDGLVWSGVRALYCGAPAGRGFDECGEKGFYVIDTDTKDYTYVKTDTKIYKEYMIDVSDCADIVALLEKVSAVTPAEGEIARAVLCGSVSGDYIIDPDDICKRTAFVEIKDKTEIAFDIMENADADTLEGEFIRILTEQLKTADSVQRQKILDAIKEGVGAIRSGI